MADRSVLKPRERRPELADAFAHLAKVAGEADFTGITAPEAFWLQATRASVPRYGDIGPAVSLEGVAFTPVSAGGVSAEWVTAEGADASRRIVYIHGGGWAAGSPQDYRALSATLARLTGAAILMVDYRLSPEHKFPAGLDDCVTAYGWALANGPDGESPARHISVMGDSAGGNLSAASVIRLIEAGARVPDRLALIAGTLDNVSMPERVGLDDEICTPDALVVPVALYLKVTDSAAHPHVSPAFAAAATLSQFPPTLIQVSTAEALLYDSKKFAARLEHAGVRVNLSLWPDMPHVWHGMLGLFPEATEALQEIADFVRR